MLDTVKSQGLGVQEAAKRPDVNSLINRALGGDVKQLRGLVWLRAVRLQKGMGQALVTR